MSTLTCVVKSWSIRLSGDVACMGYKRSSCGVLLEKSRRKRPLGVSRHRCEDNINMGYKETGWRSVDWIDLAWDRNRWRSLVNAGIKVPQSSGNICNS